MKSSRLTLVPSVHRSTHRIGLFLDATQPGLGLSQGEAHLLAHLAEVGPATVGELHRAFAHRRSSLTSYLDRLEARGDVVRAVRPEDRRSFTVSLTRTGVKTAARVHKRLLDLESGALGRLTDRDVKGFQAVLEALSTTIDADAAPRGRAARAQRTARAAARTPKRRARRA